VSSFLINIGIIRYYNLGASKFSGPWTTDFQPISQNLLKISCNCA